MSVDLDTRQDSGDHDRKEGLHMQGLDIAVQWVEADTDCKQVADTLAGCTGRLPGC